jgi:hypothetical protein
MSLSISYVHGFIHQGPLLPGMGSKTRRCGMLFYFGTAWGRAVSPKRVHPTNNFHYRIIHFIFQLYVTRNAAAAK